jgi:hypothetical protein
MKMDGRQLFGAFVRGVGLLIAIWGLYNTLFVFLGLLVGGMPVHFAGIIRILLPLIYVLVGLLFMVRAEAVVSFAYGERGVAPRPGTKPN